MGGICGGRPPAYQEDRQQESSPNMVSSHLLKKRISRDRDCICQPPLQPYPLPSWQQREELKVSGSNGNVMPKSLSRNELEATYFSELAD